MGKYISYYREPRGLFRVKPGKQQKIVYASAKQFLDLYNTNINSIYSELRVLDNHVSKLRGYLNTDQAYMLNRAGRLIMQELEYFMISWKNKNLTYYRALYAILNQNIKIDKQFSSEASAITKKIQ